MQMVTIATLAKTWGITRSGVRNYINRGQLPKGTRGGRGYVYPADTAKPEPRTRNKRGRYSYPKPIETAPILETSWAMWRAPERAP